MAYCPYCGSEIADDTKFCPNCGSPQQDQQPQQLQQDQQMQQVQPPAYTNAGAGNSSQTPYTQPATSAPQPASGKAIGSLVCGIIGLLVCGIVLGAVAIGLGTSDLNAGSNNTLAKAGRILGIVDIAGAVLLLAFTFSAGISLF